MKKYPITFLLYGLEQDQRMRDVITRELVPEIKKQGVVVIDPIFVSVPWVKPPTERFRIAKLHGSGWTLPTRVKYETIREIVPENGTLTVAIFDRHRFPLNNMVPHASPWLNLVEIFYKRGTYNRELYNRIFLHLHEIGHIFENKVGISMYDDVRSLHPKINRPEWARYWYREQFYPLRDKLPQVEYPDPPVELPVEPPVEEPTWLFDWPVDNIFVTQPFGANPQIYKNGHRGIDLRTTFEDSPNGQRPVLCSREGVVVKIGKDRPWLPLRRRGYGNYVVVDHGDGTQTLYAHLSSVAVGLGNVPAQGFVLGQSGSTGWSTGNHLHFEIRLKLSNGKVQFMNPVDPNNPNGRFLRPV